MAGEDRLMARITRLTEFLGLRRATVGLLLMVVLVGMGERLAERFLPIYILALGGGAMAIGLLQAMDNLLSALYSFPGGRLADRIGARRALLSFDILAMIGFAIVVVVPTWKAVLCAAALFISWSAVSLPATLSLTAAALPPQKRTMGVTMHSLVRRIPMALGPLIGGVLIVSLGEKEGVRAAFLLALILATLGVVAQQRLIDDSPPRGVGHSSHLQSRGFLTVARLMSPALRRLLVTDVLIRFCEQIPHAFVVVWCMRTIAEPVTALQFGLLTSIEMATSVAVYLPVAWLADRGSKKPFVLATFLFFALFPIVLLFSQTMSWLIAAFVVRGIKEFGEPTRKAMIMDLSPPDCRATMFGTYYLIRDVVVSFAALGGAFLWHISPVANFLTAAAFGAIGTVGFALIDEESLRSGRQDVIDGRAQQNASEACHESQDRIRPCRSGGSDAPREIEN